MEFISSAERHRQTDRGESGTAVFLFLVGGGDQPTAASSVIAAAATAYVCTTKQRINSFRFVPESQSHLARRRRQAAPLGTDETPL